MSTAPGDKPTEATPTITPADTGASLPPLSPPPPATTTELAKPQPADPLPATRPPTDAPAKLFLAVTAVALAGWFAWLGYAALNKSRDPIVSRAQASVAATPVRATVTGDGTGAPKTTVTVVEALKPGGLKPGAQLDVINLKTARGFTGDGDYLLLLDGESEVVVLRTSAADADPPTIYRWSTDVEAQARKLFAAKE